MPVQEGKPVLEKKEVRLDVTAYDLSRNLERATS